MKRDWEIIRKILEAGEARERESSPILKVDGIDEQELAYNAVLLDEAGLIHGEYSDALESQGIYLEYSLYRLTWEGHEFLDSLKNDKVRKGLMEKMKTFGGDLPFATIKALLPKLIMDALT